MKSLLKLISLLFMTGVFALAKAQTTGGETHPLGTNPCDTVLCIVDTLNKYGVIEVVLPTGLQQRLQSDSEVAVKVEEAKVQEKKLDPRTRYSVEVFSENRGESSKKSAEYRKRLVEQRIPGMKAVLIYEAPYWRVRVGSYKTESEARGAMRQIKSKIPSVSSDARVVRTMAR